MEQRKTEYNRISSCRSCGGKLVVTRTCHHCGGPVVWYCASCFMMYDCVHVHPDDAAATSREEKAAAACADKIAVAD